MSEQGVFAVHRGIFDHPIFAPEPFTEREAWIWMLSVAAWSAKRVRVGKAVVELQRGQLAFATRFLATKWQWSHSRVVRFLNRLKTDTMVTTQTTREATLITICKYNDYQFGRNTDETQSETPTDTQPEHKRNKEEESNNRITNIGATRAAQPSRFDEFWTEYPKRDGANPKAPAKKAFEAAVKSGADEQAIIDGAKRYRADLRRRGQEGTPYVAQAVTWLRQSRWGDDAPVSEPKQVRDWDAMLRYYTGGRPGLRAASWAWGGPEPGYPGCTVPPEIQRKHGFEPAEERAA